jgi:CRISPR-associated protein Cmr4
MASLIMGLLAETSIHPGVGRNLGVIDLPVAREAATDYPVLVGSSLKGALRDLFKGDKGNQDALFGQSDNAGQLLVSDARILLLPVRSLTGQYKWVTCPHILERFSRDKNRAGLETKLGPIKTAEGQALDEGQEVLFLEERQFTISGAVDAKIIEEVGELIENKVTRARLPKQLVILADEDFAWFARYGLSVQARNVLDEKKKTSNNLWYEETLPADTVMYALISERNERQALGAFRDCVKTKKYLQAGGNETIGQGVFFARCIPEA